MATVFLVARNSGNRLQPKNYCLPMLRQLAPFELTGSVFNNRRC